MRWLMRSLGGKGSAVNIPDGPASPTVIEGSGPDIADMSDNRDTPAGPSSASEQVQSLFSSLHFKNFNFERTTAPSPTSSKANHGNSVRAGAQISDVVEPTYLASEIQSLLKALPSPSPSTFESLEDPSQSQRDDDRRPIPLHGVNQIHDAGLIAMLQSATVMNGGQHGDDIRERRRSVWSVLESLEGEDGTDRSGRRCKEDGRSTENDFREASDIMMYSPLTPTNLSLVEIAESGIFNDEEQEEKVIDSTSETAQSAGWRGMWPFSVWSNSVAAGIDAHSTAGPAPSMATSLLSSPSSRSAHFNAQGKKRVWIPSRNKLSFQAVWWGYRIYLPPPVMDTLGDKSMEYAKRAAAITTALVWFFHNIPLAALPAAVRPAVLLLQTLIPYAGYLGSFISWSWGTIQSYDTGHGVILTATWLLPVALIPSTWGADTFPPPSPPVLPGQTLPLACPYPSSPTPRPSPTAPLLTPPVTPLTPPVTPLTPPVTPLTPPVTPSSLIIPPPGTPAGQLHMEQFPSPAQSFTTALASPLQSPAPVPSPVPYPPLAATVSSPVYLPNDNVNTDARILSPIQLVSPYLSAPSPALPRVSEPLPPWVPPPPPPSPPTIPLPEIEEETGTPKFAMRVLGKIRGGRSKKDERKEGQGTGFGSIPGVLGGGKAKGRMLRVE